MTKQQKTKSNSSKVRVVASTLLLASGGYVVIRNWQIVEQSARTARYANLLWYVCALVGTALTFMIAAAIYNTLSLHRLRYRQTLLIELSTAFVNRLLPAGIGGLGVHGVYLYKRGHSSAEATAVVSANNLLGMGAHLLLLGAVIIGWPSVLHRLADHFHLGHAWLLVAVIMIVLVVLGLSPLRERIARFGASLLKSVVKIGHRRVGKALVLAMVLTATYTLVLFLSARAVGMHLGLIETFVVFSLGMLFSTASPTPGGLVGAEAGLYAGFVGYGVASTTAGAAVVLYRLATYWLPLLPGVMALLVARQRKIL